jgi:hypothetical protein
MKMKDNKHTSTSTLPIGTEIRTSEIGYYDFWYPSAKAGPILKEAIKVREATNSELRHSTGTDWTPFVVSLEVASTLGLPIAIVWVRKEDINIPERRNQ